MKQRLLALLLTLVMLIGLLPVSALAADTITINVRVFDPNTGGVWNIDTDTCNKVAGQIQSESYRIPELSQFIGSNHYRID